MVGKTNVAGARLRAVIAVTYPAGSICTCVSGTKTLKARDTSGKALFNVTVGEWTVTATDGSSTASHAISIKADGQSDSVTLSYELYIFKSGSGMTSGYSAQFASAISGGSTSNSISSTAITWATNAAHGGNMVISPAVDLSSYNQLHVELDYTGQYSGGFVTFGVGNDTLGGPFDVYKKDTYNTSRHTITIDISAITSELYIKSTSRQSAGRFYNIWLT